MFSGSIAHNFGFFGATNEFVYQNINKQAALNQKQIEKISKTVSSTIHCHFALLALGFAAKNFATEY